MTSEATVPEAALDPACEALFRNTTGGHTGLVTRASVRAALTAALPHLSAAIRDAGLEAAFREGHSSGRLGKGPYDEDDDWLNSDTHVALKGKSIPDPAATHRHKKRGTEYVLIGYGKMQCDWVAEHTEDGIPLTADMREVAIYRSATDPTEIWVRPREEFEDGRFEEIASAPVEGNEAEAQVRVSDQDVYNALYARVPGGAEVWHWLPQEADDPENPATARPHKTAYAVIRAALETLHRHSSAAPAQAPGELVERLLAAADYQDKQAARFAYKGGQRADTKQAGRNAQERQAWHRQHAADLRAAIAALSQEQRGAVEVSNAAWDVLAERKRQVKVEGWTAEHDDQHDAGEMARAAACYATVACWNDKSRTSDSLTVRPPFWPWETAWWKPTDRRRDLVKAGALIIAEIERLDRCALAATPVHQEAGE